MVYSDLLESKLFVVVFYVIANLVNPIQSQLYLHAVRI